MCGISGIYKLDGTRTTLHDIKNMTDVLVHRGPDGEGQWLNENETVALGHRRLSIIDLTDNGAQPMHYIGRYTITFNGEIYNYIELRDELKKKGYTFHSHSDTEVLMAAYDAYGYDCLTHFDGMFSLAIWDNVKKELFCARDRFGEKPFFYQYVANKHFVFGSEMKALWAYGIPKQHNNKMIYYYLAYDVVENSLDKSETFFNNITRLEAAHYVVLNSNGELKKKRYWDIDPNKPTRNISLEEAAGQFESLFTDSVLKRLRSDVPVGSSLSGGLDSSAVVMAINRYGGSTKQNTFSARFDDPHYDEGYYMDLVRKRPNINAFETNCNVDTLVPELDKLMYHQEEPFLGPSIMAQWDVMRLAKQNNVTVLLDGQGSDEVLGGYLKYYQYYFLELYKHNRTLYNTERAAYLELRKTLPETGMRFYAEVYFPKIMRMMGNMRRQMDNRSVEMGISKEFAHEYGTLPPPFPAIQTLNQALYYDSTVYGMEKLLRFADRNSMAFSREARLPFLSHKLVEFVFSLPAGMKLYRGWTKYILRKGLENLLPAEITWRIDKKGFQPPTANWMNSKIAGERIAVGQQYLIKTGYIPKDQPKTDVWKKMELTAFLQQ